MIERLVTRKGARVVSAAGEGTDSDEPTALADGQSLVPCASERATLAVIAECREAGYSLRGIAEALNRRGLRTRSGGAWRHDYVANLLRQAAA
jgi:hypothetical protein